MEVKHRKRYIVDYNNLIDSQYIIILHNFGQNKNPQKTPHNLWILHGKLLHYIKKALCLYVSVVSL